MSEGVRKIDEFVMKDGRTLIITDSSVAATGVPNGTLFVDSMIGNMMIKLKGVNTWSAIDPNTMFAPKSVSATLLGDGCVDNTKLAVNSITRDKIKDYEITSAKIADKAIASNHYADLSISNIKIQDKAITGAKLADGSIVTANYAVASVDNIAIANNAITTIKIQDGAIATVKINDGAVTAPKLAANSVGTVNLIDLSVSTTKLQDMSVTTIKINDKAITGVKLGDLSVDSSKIADNAIITSKVIDKAITNAKIADGTILDTKLDAALKAKIDNAIKVSGATAVIPADLSVQGNISATGSIIGARVYNAVYNDLAEGYKLKGKSIPGDILELNNDGSVSVAGTASKKIIGVHSKQYAALYGATEDEIFKGYKVAVALVGKVPIRVAGKVMIGDRIVPLNSGIGAVDNDADRCFVVGKAIEYKDSFDIGYVLCQVAPII